MIDRHRWNPTEDQSLVPLPSISHSADGTASPAIISFVLIQHPRETSVIGGDRDGILLPSRHGKNYYVVEHLHPNPDPMKKPDICALFPSSYQSIGTHWLLISKTPIATK